MLGRERALEASPSRDAGLEEERERSERPAPLRARPDRGEASSRAACPYRALTTRLQALIPRLLRWAHGRLPQRARQGRDTSDLVQDALVGALGQESELLAERPGLLEAYLLRSIRHRIVDELRRSRLRERASAPISAAVGASPSALDVLMVTEEQAAFRAACARLPERAQQLLAGRLDLELPYDVLARALGYASPDAARVAAKRAVLAVGRVLGEESRAGRGELVEQARR